MAITQDEMQSIVSAVLSSIRTNSRTIDQLTPVTSLSDNDSFEINGGKRVTYKVLMGLIASLASTEHDSLKKLIANNVLKSVNIDATENSATLCISSGGKTITATIPIATTSNAGLMTAAHDRLIRLLQSAADAAQTTADAAKAVTDSKGQPDGIAPLGVDGKVPAAHLPGYVDDVVEFGAVVSGVTVWCRDVCQQMHGVWWCMTMSTMSFCLRSLGGDLLPTMEWRLQLRGFQRRLMR